MAIIHVYFVKRAKRALYDLGREKRFAEY